MRCRPYKPLSPYVGEVGEVIIECVTVRSSKFVNGIYKLYGSTRAYTNLQIKFIDLYGRCIYTEYSGKKVNIVNLKAGDSIRIKAIVKSHRKINGVRATVISHVKNISG